MTFIFRPRMIWLKSKWYKGLETLNLVTDNHGRFPSQLLHWQTNWY